MSALPDYRARARMTRRLAGALAGVLALVLAIAPLGAQPAQPATPATLGELADASPGAPAAATNTVGDLSTRRSLAWIAIGAAAAFATTSAVLALAVESREQDLEFLAEFRAPGIDAPNRYSGQVRDRYEELVDEAETLSTYSWITLGLAGVAVASATALFLLDDPGAQADAPAFARGHVAPTMLPGGMGVTLDWEF
jgi:hypothetical protein